MLDVLAVDCFTHLHGVRRNAQEGDYCVPRLHSSDKSPVQVSARDSNLESPACRLTILFRYILGNSASSELVRLRRRFVLFCNIDLVGLNIVFGVTDLVYRKLDGSRRPRTSVIKGLPPRPRACFSTIGLSTVTAPKSIVRYIFQTSTSQASQD
jgi:hypothetical protein